MLAQIHSIILIDTTFDFNNVLAIVVMNIKISDFFKYIIINAFFKKKNFHIN